MTFLPWLTLVWNVERIVLDDVMLADVGYPPAAAGPAKRDRAQSATEVSGRAGRLRSTIRDEDWKSGRIRFGVG